MASDTRNPAPLAGGNRASEWFCREAERSEVYHTALSLQVARLSRRFGLRPDRARLVASLAFQGARQ